MDALPLTLLGIRTTPKQELHCSSAEIVYGTTLRLPGGIFYPSHNVGTDNPAGYAAKVRNFMQKMHPVPPRLPQQRATYVDPALSKCTHVFLRHDAVHSLI